MEQPDAPAVDPWVAEYERAEHQPLRLVHEAEWLQAKPPADDLAPPSLAWKGHEPVHTAVYTDPDDGAPVGYVCRYPDPDKPGGKQVRAWTYGRMTGASEDHWYCKQFNRPKPIYRLYEALQRDDAQLIIVAGEKKCDELQVVLPGQVVISWAGGDKQAKHVDWDVLSFRKRKYVFLWPDADDSCREAMQHVGAELFRMGYDVRVVLAKDKPKGWDAGDAINEGVPIVAFIKANAVPFLSPRQVDVLPDKALPGNAPPDKVLPDTTFTHQNPPTGRPLGHDDMPPEPPAEIQQGKWRIDDWINAGLVIKNSVPVANLSNVALVLDNIMQDDLWWDEFLGKAMTWTSDRKGYREWTDEDDTMLTIELQRRCGISGANGNDVRKAAQAHARKHIHNEVMEYLEGLKWDQIPRLSHWLEDICNTGPGPYFSQAGRNFFISLVARAFKPGCKVDTMLVLQGKQGAGKSTVLETIGGRWYAIMRDPPESKDFAITLQGKWLIEIAEMDAFGRSDVRAVKRTLSTSEDRYRPPFGVHAKDHPRRSVFAGTTNRDDWLTDETGARRFWPAEVFSVDIDKLREDRDQLFAEAVAEFRAGATWWEMPSDETKAQTDHRFDDDPWTDFVMAQVQNKVHASVPWILDAIGIETQFQDRKAQQRVAAILTHAGWKRTTVWDKDSGKARKLWKLG
jgi:putative DNA primase/helicase